jgi:AcrR family transcriptional regulator
MAGRTKIGRGTEIADAILAVVGQEGINALTMNRLAKEVGVTSGALFRHFPSRAAMLDEAAKRAVALLDGTLPPPGPLPLERLRWFVAARTAVATEHAWIPQLVFSEQFAKALPPEGARALRGVVRRSFEFVAGVLADAAIRGEVRQDIPPADLATAVLGMLLIRTLLASLFDGDGRAAPDPEAGWDKVAALLSPPQA